MPLARPQLTSLATAIHAHRIHYEIRAERITSDEGSRLVSIVVRILGTPEEDGPRPEAARAVASALSLVAEAAVEADTGADVEPMPGEMTNDSEGEDELYITLSLRRFGEGAEAERNRTLRLVALRRNLELLGVFGDGYHMMPARLAEERDEWEVHPASAALSGF